ncbi:extracellular solute-binding protein [Halalkalicoccus jeotgali]|uniref:ABC transporter substrate-binding protein n=2 Tax=Halalkalicoccus jeotgali (strain DSM 18796 / CECT 7217 / JCM 14584 / KCTC 4019 / B3) TaxID=795797 RepID=L9VVY9_HALJB|nr:ABC transporter substrate-binding protein [Halalkalicoccus jeotgali B3]
MVSSVRRRTLLSGGAVALCGLAGCSRVRNRTQSHSATVSMLVAGSLNNALENGLRPDAETTIEIEAYGSAEVAHLIADDRKDPDIVSVADIALFDSPLHPDWFAEFATNSIVIAYNPDTEGGQRLADAGPDTWYRPVLDREVAIGRTDPDLDPLGYRALFMLELATEYYGTDRDLREAIPRREQIYPETQLVSQFETGSIDAAIAYRNMAVERGYDYIDLPAEIDLSDPSFTDTYTTATYELPSGKVVRGGLISYGSTIRHRSSAAVDVFDDHITGQYVSEFGFTIPDNYPRFTGNVPDDITN